MTNLTTQMTNKIQRFVANETTVFAEVAPSMSKNTEINSQVIYNKLFSTSRLFTKGTSIMTEQITKYTVSYDLLKLVDGSIEYSEIAV